MPKRVIIKRDRGWTLPEGAKIVDRRTKWGNPYKILRVKGKRKRWFVNTGAGLREFHFQEEAHRYSVDLYETYIEHLIATKPAIYNLDELRGHDLACHCPHELACHTDVLLRLANS